MCPILAYRISPIFRTFRGRALAGCLLPLLVALSACRIVIQTPEHGYVESVSGTYRCDPDSICVIDVDDTNFDEIFLALATDDSVEFSHWRRKFRGDEDNYLCGPGTGECALSTTGFGDSEILLGILESDQEFLLEPVFSRDIETGGTVLSECMIPKMPTPSSDYAAWNNNCSFPVRVKWIDADSCVTGCGSGAGRFQQTDPVDSLTGDIAWAVCPRSDGPPRDADGGAWQGGAQYTCDSSPGVLFSSLGNPLSASTTLSEIQANIFNRSCAFSGCHAGASPAAGQNLSEGRSFSNLVNVPSSQNSAFIRVLPGDPDNSLLIRKLEGPVPFGSRMPLGRQPLDSEAIQSIRDWISAGALDN